MKTARPDLLTIIVPRHPERGPRHLRAACAPARSDVALRSEGKLPDARTDIYVADTIGELGLFYALAPVAFVGGSLADRGGQNPVEPIKLGAAVLTGPNWQNFRDSYGELLKRGRLPSRSPMRQASPRPLSLCSNDGGASQAMTERAEPRHCRHERRAAAHARRARTLSAAEDDPETCVLKRRSGGIASRACWRRRSAPLGRLYGRMAEARFARVEPYRSRLPVICVGNFTAGGGGKTPTAIAIAALLTELGDRPAFLTRGYGGTSKGTVLVAPRAERGGGGR